jgi:dipeptidyl aminopeptidase/acylaminoacyl peptidase
MDGLPARCTKHGWRSCPSLRRLINLAFFLLSLSLPVAGQTTSPLAEGASTRGLEANRVIVTPEKLFADYSSRSPVPSLRWLPNSRQAVFAMPDQGQPGSKRTTWIQIMDVGTGKCERLVQGSNPRPSPDGSAIAYVSGEGALSVYYFEGRNIKNLVSLPPSREGSSIGFSWSPDSRRIAYGYRPATPPKKNYPADRKSVSVLVVGGPEDVPPDSEVWVVDTIVGSQQKLTSGPYQFASPGWFPDGNSFLFTSVGSFEYKNDNVAGKVLAVSVPSGEVRTLIRDSGVTNLRPVISPDGKQIAFTYDPTNVVYPHYWNIATIPVDGGSVHQLTRNIFVASGPIWSPDGGKIYFNCKEGVFTQICSVSVTGEMKRLTSAPRNASDVTLSPDGKRLLWTTEDTYGKAEVRVANADGTGERVLVDLGPDLKTLALSKVEEIRWKSLDGLEIAGLLIKPLAYERGKKYPLLVSIHGGPVGGVSLRGEIFYSSPLEWQMWAARGFAVFLPDYRSSEVSGWEPFLKAREKQDYNDRDMDDIMSGVDHVINLGIADPEQLGVIGHSYGSLMTNWIITHTKRFKVAVSYEGIADLYMSYATGLRVGGNSIEEWLFKGKPWEVPGNYRKNSATEYVKGVTTPTLFISGDYSGGSGVENLYHHEFMYTALKKQGVDTQLVIYKGEGHLVTSPQNQRDLLTRILDWIDTHLTSRP